MKDDWYDFYISAINNISKELGFFLYEEDGLYYLRGHGGFNSPRMPIAGIYGFLWALSMRHRYDNIIKGEERTF